MKKYWQIKPWLFIVPVLLLVAILAYMFSQGGSSMTESFQYNTKAGSVSGSSRMMDLAVTDEAYAPAPAMDAGSFGLEEETSATVDRMMIKTGSLSMVVDDVRKSVDEIVKYAEGKDGFLVNSDISKNDLDLSGSITVRVPSADLEATIVFIKDMGDVQSEHIDGRDITEEYVDLEAKLGNLEATEQQFLEIMKKASKIEDVLAVQRELSSVRSQIESMEGRMKYLKESVDLSSLTVYLSTNPSTLPVVDEDNKWKPLAVFKDALRSLLDTGKGVVNGLIWFGIYIPVILVIVLIAWGVRKLIRRRKGK